MKMIRYGGPITRVRPVGSPIGYGGQGFKSTYSFNGTTMYGTVAAPWSANGFPQSISFEFTYTADAVNQFIFSAADPLFYMGVIGATGIFSFRYQRQDGTARFIDWDTPLVDGETYKVEGALTVDGGSLTINGVTEDAPALNSEPTLQTPIPVIAALTDFTQKLIGPMWNLNQYDGSPIQGREYRQGTGADADYGQLNTAVPVQGDFTISFDFVRVDHNPVTNASIGALLGVNTGITSELQIFDTEHPTSPNRVQIALGSTTQFWDNALAGVALGQHITLRIERIGTDCNLYIDDIPDANNPRTLATDGFFERIGSVAGRTTRNFTDKMANLTITTQQPQEDGFYDYDNLPADTLDFGTLTAGTTANLVESGSTHSYNSNGVLIGNDGSRLTWEQSFYGSALDNGFTIRYEIEKSIFDESNPPIGTSTGLTQGSLVSTAQGYVVQYEGGAWKMRQGDANTIVQLSNDTYGDHVELVYSYDTVTGSKLYLNRTLVLHDTTIAADMGATLGIGCLGGIGEQFLNPLARIKNVALIPRPTTFTTYVSKVITAVGDSQLQQGQFQSGAEANNNPPALLTGRTGYVDEINALPNTTVTENWRQLSQFGWIVSGCMTKGIDAQISSNAYGGCVISDQGTVGSRLQDRVDSVFNLNTQDPTGVGAGVTDIWIVNCGGNDVAIGVTPEYDEPILEAQIQRMLDDGAELVILNSTTKNYNQPQPDSNYIAFNAMIKAVADRHPRVTYNDLWTGWSQGYVYDNVHANLLGNKIIGEKTAALIPNALLEGEQTYNYPLARNTDDDALIENIDAETGAAFNGLWTEPTWEDVPSNTRTYPMHEGSGARFYDSLDPDPQTNEIVIVAADDGNWSTKE